MRIGTSEYDPTDFLIAVQDGLTCKDCGHCQVNIKRKDRSDGFYCYHDSAQQQTLGGTQAITVAPNFLCNRFEMSKDVYDEYFKNDDFLKALESVVPRKDV